MTDITLVSTVVDTDIGGPGPAVPPYVGPGDIVSGATAFYALRSYSQATVGNRLIRLRRDSDNDEEDFFSLENGALDVSAVAAFKTGAGAANLFCVTLYDQTLNVLGLDLTRGTAAEQPAFTLAGLGSLPILQTDTSGMRLDSTGVTLNQPKTFSLVFHYVTPQSDSRVLWCCPPWYIESQRAAAANETELSGDGFTTTLTATCADNAWHAVQYVLNGASSSITVDNSTTSGSAGTGAGGPAAMQLFNFGGVAPWAGKWVECGLWPSAFSGTERTNMDTNQSNYWGV